MNKKTKAKVPATKIPEKKVVKLTKTQRDSFIQLRNEISKQINDLNQFLVANMLSPKVGDYIVELGLDGTSWQFNADTLEFIRQEKK